MNVAVLVEDPSTEPALLPSLAFLLAFLGVGLALWSALPRVLGRDPETAASPPSAWGLLDVGRVLVAGFLFLLLLGTVVARLGPPSFLTALVASQGAMAATAGFGWLVARARDPRARAVLGFPPSDAWPGSSWTLRAILAYGLALPGMIAVQAAWSFAAPFVGIQIEPQQVMLEILGQDGPILALSLSLAVVFGPLVEEVLFRGFVQPGLIRATGRATLGIAWTSLAFGALHGVSAFPQIFLLSLLLGWIRHRSGSTTLAWSVHALHNGLQIVLAFQMPDLTAQPLDSP